MAFVNLYSKISDIASDNINLNPIEILKEIEKKENCIKKIDDEIKSLYYESYSDVCDAETKVVVDDMITNITDGQFKDLINEEPVPMDPNIIYDTTPEKKLKTLNTIKALLENLKLKRADNSGDTLNIDICDIKIKSEDVVSTKRNIENVLISLNQLKCNVENMVLHPSLNEAAHRDTVFENNAKEVCKKINDFNKVFKAAEQIENICKKATNEDNNSNEYQSNLPKVIAELLKDVERLINYDTYEPNL